MRNGEVCYNERTTFVFAPDPTDLTLIETEGRWSLDKSGTRPQACVFSFSDAAGKTFDRYIAEGYAREGLMEVKGDMVLSLDAETGVYWIEVQGEDNGDGFHAAFRALPEVVPAEAAADEEAVANRGSSSCSAKCKHGECSISCTFPKYAYCGCTSDGQPDCQCIDRIKNIELWY